MTSEPHPIRVRPLTRMLNGEDPAEFMLRLTESGYSRFYVRVPEGFRCDFKAPRDLFAHRRRNEEESPPSLIRNHGEPSYLQLDEEQVQKLIEHQPITLSVFSSGALFRRLRNDRLPSIDFDHQRIRLGTLEPIGHAIAHATPTMVEPRSGAPVVVKALRPNSNMYTYHLNGVDFSDIYVEEAGVTHALAKAGAIASVREDLPDDPYGLEHSSPLVYAILCRAYRNRGKARGEIHIPSLAAEFSRLNAGYKTNPMPFKNGRHLFAANLSNPCYTYNAKRARQLGKKKEVVEVPANDFLDKEFVNDKFRKILYAACRWSGAMATPLGNDREKLVDLLVDLGFLDADENDQVQASVFFITGEMYKRNEHGSEFRHFRRDRG